MNKTQLKINAKVIDDNAREQIRIMSESPAFHGLISIMPDVHLGIGAVIGFTGKFRKCVIPNVVGVDIGCGVTSYPLGNIEIDFEKLDKHIRQKIPLGFNSHRNTDYFKDLPSDFRNRLVGLGMDIRHNFYEGKYEKFTMPLLQLGTLGGGNHFIEIDVDDEGNKYLTVHSGSRNFGLKVALYYQNKAKEFHKSLPQSDVATHLEYLPMKYGGDEYLEKLYIAQNYASLNRRVMIMRILKFFNVDYSKDDIIESVHNFISQKDNVIRKGAISAHKGEQVIIPLSMKDGIVLGVGKGNASYNNSAPHGAGRIFGRKHMRKLLQEGKVTMAQFEKSMEGIYSTCVNKKTIDESPFAYKHLDDIKEYLEETVEITKILKPIYNLKAT